MTSTLARNTNGLEHGLINTLGNSVADNGFKHFSEKDRPKLEKQRKEDEKLVKAQYLNKSGKSERLERCYCKWAGQPITMWRFIHGEIYEVPKGLVDDVNDPSKRTRKRSGLVGQDGKPLETDEYDDPVHRFVPVGF
jgi:hypothetical protein